jgi:hypothetical protein
MVAVASIGALLAVDALVKHRHAKQTREHPTAATSRLAS